ncbi:MAG: hypothetical protein A2512_13555 [Deltaproteobacteria bacterium RIFOXYD12_FULL_56_24]|nr:MAG: hypothetical protein A2512_13555 [Deltaproteobacteria bacterium RIFOXYD12_FULL_56_24]
MVNDYPKYLNDCIAKAFGWDSTCIEWLSPLRDDDYAEYYDQEFLERLSVNDLRMPLHEFWPKSGPRWDGLARAKDGKLILIEAKAHIEEAVDYRSKASANALARIEKRLDEAKTAFRANPDAPWCSPLYQMANRLAHLYFLAEINKKDAYLVFVNFANAADVEIPVAREEWKGATRLAHKCLGLKDSRLSRRVTSIIIDLKEIISQSEAYQ